MSIYPASSFSGNTRRKYASHSFCVFHVVNYRKCSDFVRLHSDSSSLTYETLAKVPVDSFGLTLECFYLLLQMSDGRHFSTDSYQSEDGLSNGVVVLFVACRAREIWPTPSILRRRMCFTPKAQIGVDRCEKVFDGFSAL